MLINLLEKPNFHSKPEPVDPMEEVLLEADKKVHFGTTLNNMVKEELVNLLKCRTTTFAWHPEDVIGVDSTIITHKLSIDDLIKSIQQKKRKFAPEKQQVIKEEVNKLLSTRLIKKVQYST